jgi:hypothetical protein
MALPGLSLSWIAASLLVSCPAVALERFATDVGVTRELADSHGHRFAVTFRPPSGRALDPRILNAFEISISSGTADASGGVSRGPDAVLLAESDSDPIDVTGYTIQVEAVNLSSCRAEVHIAKSRPGILQLFGRVIFLARGASSMSIVAFPTSGNVDVEISVNNQERCGSSRKPEGTLDVAACTLPGCNDVNGIDYLEGSILNPRASNVKYVGVATIVFAN